MHAVCLLLAVLACDPCEPYGYDYTLPLVEESVCEVAIVYRVDHDYASWPTVVFIKGGRQLATRAHSDSMLVVVEGDEFVLIWQDWECQRAVRTKRLGVYELEPLSHEGQEWWVAPVLDLKAPPPPVQP